MAPLRARQRSANHLTGGVPWLSQVMRSSSTLPSTSQRMVEVVWVFANSARGLPRLSISTCQSPASGASRAMPSDGGSAKIAGSTAVSNSTDSTVCATARMP